MTERIKQFIDSNNLLTKNAKVVVGVSGGADSVALVCILQQLGYSCIIAHVNFNLRGNESERDENFTRELALKLQLPFFQTSFNTIEVANTRSISIEMAARELRYTWFNELLQQTNAEAIAVAHHSDDNAETLLMNLTRGTGIKGLTGIPVKNQNIVRPLLCVSRSDIEQYLQSIHQEYVTDSSNLQNDYNRNQFRNLIIPAIEKINPSFKTTITANIERFKEVQAIYDKQINSDIEQITIHRNHQLIIDLNKLRLLEYKRTVLFEILNRYGFSNDAIQRISNFQILNTGSLFFSETHKALIDRDKIIVSDNSTVENYDCLISENDSEVFEPVHLKIKKRTVNSEIIRNNKVLTIDISKAEFPLRLRTWKQGDIIYPYGLNGKQKLSDLFTNFKMNRFEKEKQLVLLSGEKIMWVVGIKADKRFSVDENSSEILEIELIK